MEIEETTTVENNDCDFVDIGGAEQSLSHENRSWKFCKTVSLPSAEVVFFTQVCFIFILLSLSISKLSFYNLSCDETAIWLSILSSAVGYMLPNSQVIIMNKIISTKDRLFMSVSEPSGSGKTDLIFQMFLKGTFYPSYNKIFYFYLHDQPKYRQTILANNISLVKSFGESCYIYLKN